MAIDRKMLETALTEAHLPSLAMATIHLTGDASLLDGDAHPLYDFWGDGQGGLDMATQQRIRDRARDAILAHLDDGRPMAPIPEEGTVRRMMDWIAGQPIPEDYFGFLMEELALAGEDPKRPQWSAARLGRGRTPTAIIIGAGMSGLLTAIRMDQAGIDFAIVEKNADVGGTWLENQYPGCRVDTPNHLYSYSFEDNHHWPEHYSTQPVLLDYFRGVADRHDLRRRTRFETLAEEAHWDDGRARWRVRVTSGGRSEWIEADIMVAAVGQLNQPRYPDVAGLGSFAGPAFHSARWDHGVGLDGKRVAVIGTGASAFQFVPEIAPRVASLKVFQRTPPWLGPTPNYHDRVGEGFQWLVEHFPAYDKWYRFWLFWMMTDGVLDFVRADADWAGPPGAVGAMNAELRALLEQAIRAQIPERPDLADAAIPAYPFGGKRSLRDNGVWLKALARDNVTLVTTPIEHIDARGIVTADGALHDADVLIYGTGFHASDFLRTLKVHGRGGRELHELWKGDARAYLGMTVPEFPNLFLIYGPNTNIVVNGSIIFFSECSVRYIMGCIELMLREDLDCIEVRRDVHDRFNARVDAANAQMAWGAPQVSSWYKNALGRVSQNWPFRLVDYWEATLRPDPADFLLRERVHG